jgi:hypothetical protein
MSQSKLIHAIDTKTVDLGWIGLYKAGGAAAVIMVAITIAQFIIFISWPPPLAGSVLDWFTLFQDNWLRGLLSFELLMIVYVCLSTLLALALFVALKRINKSLMAIYLALSLVGVIAFIAARPAFEMLSISNQYAAATTDAQRSVLLAAGEGMLAVFNGTAFYVSYVLGSITGLVVSFVMIRSKIFSKATAYARIVSSILDFGLFIPAIGIFISMFSVVFLLICNILIARRLFNLASMSKGA